MNADDIEWSAKNHRDEKGNATDFRDIYRKTDGRKLGVAKKERSGWSFTPDELFAWIGPLFAEKMIGLKIQIANRFNNP